MSRCTGPRLTRILADGIARKVAQTLAWQSSVSSWSEQGGRMAITSTLTPFDNFSGHSKVRFGVGEQVKLDIKEVPPVNPATPVAWVIKSGPASVHNDPKSPGRGTLECGNRAGAVVLELRNTKTKDLVDTKRFQVVEPSEARF